ncbi:MAG TPA: diacylglycerol kinase family lipid kinase, partial [Leptospiraceae bacterium]|nr:diacylglycerol kinase family lipid kinase [Leptospiraceae bacterium]
AGDGKTENLWPKIEKELHDHSVTADKVYTAKRGDGIRLTRQALDLGFERVVSVGGDGTLNEVVNGFFEEEKLINPDAVLGFIMTGRVNDFRKTVETPSDLEGSIAKLLHGRIKKMDLINVRYIAHEGMINNRYSINMSSFGISGDVCKKVNDSKLGMLLGGTGVFFYESLSALAEYKNKNVVWKIDDGQETEGNIRLFAAANGKYAGGSMLLAPDAKIDDGFMDYLIVEDMNAMSSLLHLNRLYTGNYSGMPGVSTGKAKKIEADSRESVHLEIEGECVGRLPAVFSVVSSVLNVQL